MDMLFKRYACPFSLLEQTLLTGRFEEWIDEFIKIINEDTEDQALWEMYLHSQFLTESFEDFKRKCKIPSTSNQPIVNVEATIQQSFDMLNNFNPEI